MQSLDGASNMAHQRLQPWPRQEQGRTVGYQRQLQQQPQSAPAQPVVVAAPPGSLSVLEQVRLPIQMLFSELSVARYSASCTNPHIASRVEQVPLLPAIQGLFRQLKLSQVKTCGHIFMYSGQASTSLKAHAWARHILSYACQ